MCCLFEGFWLFPSTSFNPQRQIQRNSHSCSQQIQQLTIADIPISQEKKHMITNQSASNRSWHHCTCAMGPGHSEWPTAIPLYWLLQDPTRPNQFVKNLNPDLSEHHMWINNMNVLMNHHRSTATELFRYGAFSVQLVYSQPQMIKNVVLNNLQLRFLCVRAWNKLMVKHF